MEKYPVRSSRREKENIGKMFILKLYKIDLFLQILFYVIGNANKFVYQENCDGFFPNWNFKDFS
jgi:hypothetical protein